MDWVKMEIKDKLDKLDGYSHINPYVSIKIEKMSNSTKLASKKKLTFSQFRLLCPFKRKRCQYCDHKGNSAKAAHYQFKKKCIREYCPFRNELNMNEFDVVTPKGLHRFK